MTDLDDAFGSLVGMAARFDEPVDVIVTRAGQRLRRRRTIQAIGAVVVVGAVVVGIVATVNGGRSTAPTISIEPTTVATAPGAPVSFRDVLGQVPYAGKVTKAPTAPTSCENGTLITPARPTSEVILPDAAKQSCYMLGPTLLSERVLSAAVDVNQTSDTPEIDLQFPDNAFVTKVAVPYVGHTIAIIVSGIVESAPTIDAGITGDEVTISANFTQATALQLVETIAPGSANHTTTSTTPTPTTISAVDNAMKSRCQVAGPAFGSALGGTYGGSVITVAAVRAWIGNAHGTVPAFLARAAGDDKLAWCFAQALARHAPATSTSVCANGEPAAVPALVAFAVDARLNTVLLPDTKYFGPPGHPLGVQQNSPPLCLPAP